jgi:rubrerythrin
MVQQDILDNLSFAIQAEISAYVFYRHAMEKVKDRELKETLKSLANDEREHFRVLESQYDSLHRSERWITYKDALLVKGLPDIDEKITDAQKEMLGELEALTSQKAILELGLQKEQRAYELYKRQLEKATLPESRDMLERLMNFELGHVRKLESLIKKTPV